MKKPVLFCMSIFCLMLLFNSCASGKNKINDITSKVYVGMTIEEFNKVVKRKSLVTMQDGITIYKVERHVWYDSDRSGADLRFFYFYQGKLTNIDEGERGVDRRIQIDHK